MVIKQIKEFPDYTIREDGVITHVITNTIKKSRVGKNGYPVLNLYSNGFSKQEYVHRLVAKTFIPNPENKRTVNHIDGIKTNNHVYNLEWATDSENIKHAYDNGLNSRPKLHTEDELLNLYERFKTGESFEEIAKSINCATSAITVNLRKLLVKLGKEAELDHYIVVNKNMSMKQAGINKRNLINLKMIDKKTLKVKKIFNSITEAKNYLDKSSSGPISNALSKHTKSAFGYYWIESNDDITDYSNSDEKVFWTSRKTKGTNKYVGIRLRKDTKKYSCYIKSKSLGCFTTEDEALEYRNQYAKDNNLPNEIQIK